MLKIMLKNKYFTIMNKKLTTTLALVLFCSPFFCQAQPVALTTPNGTPVWAFKGMEMPLDCIAVFNYYCVTNYPNAILLDTSTSTYNCHGFAWSMADGGPLCKISDDDNNLAKFWDDYSYLESTEYEKIYYSGGKESHADSTTKCN